MEKAKCYIETLSEIELAELKMLKEVCGKYNYSMKSILSIPINIHKEEPLTEDAEFEIIQPKQIENK